VEIDLGAIRYNAAALAAMARPSLLCAVVKADAYGHGDVPVAEAVLEAGADMLAVALVEEGVRLREAGIVAPILVLSEPPPEDLGDMVDWDLTPTVYRLPTLLALDGRARGRLEVHLKVDTGMHRVGASPEELPGLMAAMRGTRHLRLGGLWTHFAVADEDPAFTETQIRRFAEIAANFDSPFCHLANTAGAILYPHARAGMVRIGIGLYGIHPSDQTRRHVALRPAMRIVSRVALVRALPGGARPSYGRRRSLPQAGTVATVPIGYADGVPRRLAETGGEVIIRGRRYPLAGAVTMDQIMVDVGLDPIEAGDEVVLLGKHGDEEITADEWAARLGTIPYEVVCQIGPRLPRRYLG
jgi:alanine racemase